MMNTYNHSNAGQTTPQPHRQQEQRTVAVGGGGHPEDERASGGAGVPAGADPYAWGEAGDDSSNIERIIEKPPSVDLGVWKYEHIRQFVLELNLLATSLRDICGRESCPTMKGSAESEFLCAAHKTATNCSAIDYMLHNLDQSTSILLNLKHFQSRVSISETKSLDTIVRRLYRLFSHTYHFHREVFDEFEKDMHLCQRFTLFSLKYGLLEEAMLNVPRQAYSTK